jgi:hypothetical protein
MNVFFDVGWISVAHPPLMPGLVDALRLSTLLFDVILNVFVLSVDHIIFLV